MANIRQKEISFLRRLKRRFEDLNDYRDTVNDMVNEGLISAAAANEELGTYHRRPSKGTFINPDELIEEAVKKVTAAKKRKVPPTKTSPPAYGGCAGNVSRC